MNEEIEKLITLQGVDDDIAALDREIGRHRQVVADREEEISAAEALMEEKKARISELEARQREIGMDRQESQERIKDRQSRIMQVQTDREHQALLKEIGDHKQRIKDLDDEELRNLEEKEALAAEVEELAARAGESRQALEEEKKQADREVKKINTRRRKLVKQRGELIATMGQAIVSRYEMLIEKRQGKAVTEVRDSVCQGCHMTLPPQQYNEVLRGDKLHFCPTCMRILYHRPPGEE